MECESNSTGAQYVLGHILNIAGDDSLKVFYRGKYHVTRNTFIVSDDLDNCVEVLVTLLQKIRDYPMPIIQEAVEGLQIYGRLESKRAKFHSLQKKSYNVIYSQLGPNACFFSLFFLLLQMKQNSE